jgi:hypothetical protein
LGHDNLEYIPRAILDKLRTQEIYGLAIKSLLESKERTDENYMDNLKAYRVILFVTKDISNFLKKYFIHIERDPPVKLFEDKFLVYYFRFPISAQDYKNSTYNPEEKITEILKNNWRDIFQALKQEYLKLRTESRGFIDINYPIQSLSYIIKKGYIPIIMVDIFREEKLQFKLIYDLFSFIFKTIKNDKIINRNYSIFKDSSYRIFLYEKYKKELFCRINIVKYNLRLLLLQLQYNKFISETEETSEEIDAAKLVRRYDYSKKQLVYSFFDYEMNKIYNSQINETVRVYSRIEDFEEENNLYIENIKQNNIIMLSICNEKAENDKTYFDSRNNKFLMFTKLQEGKEINEELLVELYPLFKIKYKESMDILNSETFLSEIIENLFEVDESQSESEMKIRIEDVIIASIQNFDIYLIVNEPNQETSGDIGNNSNKKFIVARLSTLMVEKNLFNEVETNNKKYSDQIVIRNEDSIEKNKKILENEKRKNKVLDIPKEMYNNIINNYKGHIPQIGSIGVSTDPIDTKKEKKKKEGKSKEEGKSKKEVK